jgi:hypothetical protein
MVITGAIFENGKKKNDKQPDLHIKLEIDGVQVSVGGWKRRSKKNNTVFFSVYGDTNKAPQAQENDTGMTKHPDGSLDDDIPF